MSLQCRLVDLQEIKAKGEELQPGDMWYSSTPKAGEKVLVIKLPCGDAWRPIGPNGWNITGEPPNITARPSIMCEHYHGWLTDGVFSDDLEGRTHNLDTDGK